MSPSHCNFIQFMLIVDCGKTLLPSLNQINSLYWQIDDNQGYRGKRLSICCARSTICTDYCRVRADLFEPKLYRCCSSLNSFRQDGLFKTPPRVIWIGWLIRVGWNLMKTGVNPSNFCVSVLLCHWGSSGRQIDGRLDLHEESRVDRRNSEIAHWSSNGHHEGKNIDPGIATAESSL